MKRLREILLTQYIGAIVIGLVAAQGVIEAMGVATLPLRWYLGSHNAKTQSVLFNEQPRALPFPWESTLSGLTTVLLYFAASFLIAQWLFPADLTTDSSQKEETPEPQDMNE
jgi:hypothetical protein